jgi:hypothetical protein
MQDDPFVVAADRFNNTLSEDKHINMNNEVAKFSRLLFQVMEKHKRDSLITNAGAWDKARLKSLAVEEEGQLGRG